MSYPFNSTTISSENSKEATLVCRLKGFKPSDGSHSASATVSDNVLIVTANVGGKTHQYKIRDIGVSADAVTAKPKSDEVQVIIKKPSGDYSLASKMQR